MSDTTEFWRAHYGEVHREGKAWLDYSNERVQAQSFGVAFEALGPVGGRRCLDVGAGRGQFAGMLLAAGATSVTALELVPPDAAGRALDSSRVDWRAGDAGDAASYAGLRPFDLVSALEVLQYVPFGATLELLFSLVKPGGRLVGIIPNRDCALVQKPMERFQGKFGAVSASDLRTHLSALPDVDVWRHRGMRFAEDQRVAPYDVSAWGDDPAASQPNRFAFVALRKHAQEGTASQPH